MGFYDDLDAQQATPMPAPLPDASPQSRGFYDDLGNRPVPLPQPKPVEAASADQPSLARRIYRGIGGMEPGNAPPQLPSTDVNKPAPSERLQEAIGFWPTLGLQLFPPTGAALGVMDLQYHTNRGEFGSAALQAPSALAAGPKVLKDVAKEGFVAPTSKELLETGGKQFNEYRALPKTYVGADIEALGNSMRTGINAGTEAAPITHEAINSLIEKAKKNPFVTPEMIDDFRVATSEASKKGEAGAMRARDMLYGYLSKTGDPADELLMQGVKNYGAGKRGEIVDTILRKGAGKTNEGEKLDAAARSLVDNSAKRLRGFTSAEVAGLDKAREAGSGLHTAGSYLSGSAFGGLPGALGAPSIAGVIGNAVVPGVGATAGAVPLVGGQLLKSGGANLRRGAIEEIGNLVRSRAPASEAAKLAYETGPVMTPQAGRNAIARALMTQGPQNVGEDQANWLLDRTVNPFIYGGM